MFDIDEDICVFVSFVDDTGITHYYCHDNFDPPRYYRDIINHEKFRAKRVPLTKISLVCDIIRNVYGDREFRQQECPSNV